MGSCFCLHLYQINLMAETQPNSQLNIEISEETAEGQYANLAIITHSHAEFVIDFVNVMPGTPKSRVRSRIILTPQHAKRFMKALTENLGRFETANGKIQDLEEVQLPLNFGGPTAQAHSPSAARRGPAHRSRRPIPSIPGSGPPPERPSPHSRLPPSVSDHALIGKTEMSLLAYNDMVQELYIEVTGRIPDLCGQLLIRLAGL
jgi:hypothetical protein